MRRFALLLLICFTFAPVRAEDAPATQPAPLPDSHAHLDADEPAQMLPAATGAFVQINDLGQWRKRVAGDPILMPVLRLLPPQRNGFAWTGLEQTLGLKGDDILDQYCGRRLVIAGPVPGKRSAVTFIMRVEAEQGKRLVDRMPLEPIERAGPFEMYSTPDNRTRIAVHQRWIAMSHTRHEREMRSTLLRGGNGRVLANDTMYQAWSGRLPKPRCAEGFFRGHDSGHAAAVALTDDERTVSLHYVGRPPQCDSWFERLGDNAEPQWPHLPSRTVAAMTINLSRSVMPNQRDLEDINRFLRSRSGKTFHEDIARHIVSPMVVLLGDVDIRTEDDDNARAWPAVAVAIRLDDTPEAFDAAANLTDILDAAVEGFNRTYYEKMPNRPQPGIPTRNEKHREVLYHVAEVGNLLAQRYDRQEFSHIRFAYGRIGPWYVVATHDAFFNAWLDAHHDESARLDPGAYACRKLERPCGKNVAVGFVRSDAAAHGLDTWVNYWQATRPMLTDLAQFEPRSIEARIAKYVMASRDFFAGSKRISARFHKDATDDLVVGRIDVVRKGE